MALDPKLLEILACPEDKGPLLYFEDESSLYNPRLKRRYAVRDDIPIMLIDEAETVDDAEHDAPRRQGRGRRHPAHLRGVARRDGGRLARLRRRARALPEQLAAAHEARRARCRRVALPAADDFDNIVALGMGGSGIAGDVLQAVGTATLPGAGHGAQAVPHAGVRRAAHARVRGLVLGRHRGDARDGTRRARGRRARSSRSRAAARSRELARESGALHVPCPDGIRCRGSRSARWSRRSFVMLFRMGMLPEAHAGARCGRRSSSRAGATSAGPRSTAPRNPARELARKIGRTIPLIYGSGGLGGVAAMRWKSRVNENAKAPAFWNTHPELDHNEICGWGQHGDVTRQVFTLVELRHGFEHARLERAVRSRPAS